MFLSLFVLVNAQNSKMLITFLDDFFSQLLGTFGLTVGCWYGMMHEEVQVQQVIVCSILVWVSMLCSFHICLLPDQETLHFLV